MSSRLSNNDSDQYFTLSDTSSISIEILNINAITNNNTQSSINNVSDENINNNANNIFKNASNESFNIANQKFDQFSDITRQTKSFVKEKKVVLESLDLIEDLSQK